MKKLLILIMIFFSTHVFGQTVNPETKQLPKFTQDVTALQYVENSQVYHAGFTSAKFLFVEQFIFMDESIYYVCYDKNSQKWIVFAVYLRKYNLWHINTKFIHLLTF